MSDRVFLVRKLVVQGNTDREVPSLCDVSRWVPVAAFRTREQAEADAAERNRLAVETLNPIWMNDVHGPLLDKVAVAVPPELGVTVPPPEVEDSQFGYSYETTDNIARWYDERVSDWPAEVRAAVWRQLAPNTDLFDVTEIGLDG